MISLFTVFMPPEVDAPLLETLHSGYIGQGPKVEQFETTLAEFFDTRHVLTLNSGTSALHLALRLAGVEPGTEVITTAMTCTASNMPILANGGTIVWADVDPKTGLIDPRDVERKITPKTKAILCVDWGGTPCDLDALMALGDRHGISVIEDAAHALGATYKGHKVGTTAHFTCFSFQAIKHITTVDGGLLICRDPEAYRRGKLLRWYGINRETDRKDFRCEENIEEWGYKFHMNDVAATIGLTVFPHLPEILSKHRANAAFYRKTIQRDVYIHPSTLYETQSAFWLYTLVLPSQELRDRFMAFMKHNGVMTSAVHARNDTHTCFAPFRSPLPGTEAFASCEVCIPVHWRLSEAERFKIATLCNEFASHV